MYKVTDQVEHKKSGKVYEILHIHNDTLFGKDYEDNAKSMNIDDVVPAKSEREKVVEDMLRDVDTLSEYCAQDLYDAGYRKVVEENVENNGDGWITWEGGECPVDDKYEVGVKFRNGEKFVGGFIPKCLSWKNYGFEYDIIAYKVL